MSKVAQIFIGVDPGTNTGLAIWNTAEKKFESIETLSIFKALMKVNQIIAEKKYVTVRIEDARQRKWFGNAGREQLQGAGSIKRDCTIWEEFLTEIGVTFTMVPPKNNRTKMTAPSFKAYTKWNERTSEHSRDAAMLVFGI